MIKHKIRWALMVYDSLVFVACSLFILGMHPGTNVVLPTEILLLYTGVGVAAMIITRGLAGLYQEIWRYAGPGEYIKMTMADAVACAVLLGLRRLFPQVVSFPFMVSLFSLDLLGCIVLRLSYQWAYQHRMAKNRFSRWMLLLLRLLTGISFGDEKILVNRIRVAIIGAGSVGSTLADELLKNPRAIYQPVCFVDVDEGKAGRSIWGIPVVLSDGNLQHVLHTIGVQEVVFAIPGITAERREELYKIYSGFGYKIKTYDVPTLNSDEDGKRHIHDFDVEELLFRSTSHFLDDKSMASYTGKNVMITGGGGSIGSELARQIARCRPARLVILDIYENGAYDIQQELKAKYGDDLNLRVEIANICDRESMEKLFLEHTPDIVFHAAAHKHVPLMERNVCEAVGNNVFGTLNVVELCEKYKVGRFIMVSTDKAVNPTNVMGATKRMCEMIVQSRERSDTTFAATRFGNVLGSNGSVLPLFRRQIAAGGPVTVTDKRIVRYFMTIPEAAQLVIACGAMAKRRELFALNMGKPVRILDLAERMIRLSGFEPYKDIDIVEIGLRAGEKLYEELLIKTEELDKTDNDMIFVERDKPLPQEEIDKKLDILRKALETRSNRAVRAALMEVVPTYHTPEEVNERAIEAEEMRLARDA